MYQLFYNKPTLNGDSSKWNVASVSNMQLVCAASSGTRSVGSEIHT
jgi:hypothetical protein